MLRVLTATITGSSVEVRRYICVFFFLHCMRLCLRHRGSSCFIKSFYVHLPERSDNVSGSDVCVRIPVQCLRDS